jgi:hypothetical protein
MHLTHGFQLPTVICEALLQPEPFFIELVEDGATGGAQLRLFLLKLRA